MSILEALLLGLLQGATEFVPVSSSGHLVLIPALLGWSDPGLAYSAVVHLGTLLAVVLYLRADIAALITGWFRSVRLRRIDSSQGRLAWLLIISAIPAGLIGFLLNDFFESLFGAPVAVASLLLVTGLFLFVSDLRGRQARALTDITWRDAALIGLAQGLAVAPGISRSGSTIAAGVFRGLHRDDAARFSFLMAIPVIVGAGGYELLKAVLAGLSNLQGITLLVGFVAALVSGYLAIWLFLSYLRKHSVRPFAYYCWAVGALFLVLTALGVVG